MERALSHEGGRAYLPDFKEELSELFTIGLLKGTFYQSEEEMEEEVGTLLEEALKACPQWATTKAIEGASLYNLKTVPLLWLLHLSSLEDKSLFQAAFPRIIINPPRLHQFVTLARKGNVRKGLGRSVKSAVNLWIRENLSEYWACRYKTKLGQVMRLTRPRVEDGDGEEYKSWMSYIQTGALEFPRVRALKQVLEDIHFNKVTESTLESIRVHRLQLEELKHQFGTLDLSSRRKVVAALLGSLNYGALIGNLASIEGLFQESAYDDLVWPPGLVDMLVHRIQDQSALHSSRVLPFPLLSAHELIHTKALKAAIERALIGEVERHMGEALNGPLLVAVDVSTSMTQSMVSKSLSAMDIAALFGALLKHASPNIDLYAVASDRYEVDMGETVMETAKNLRECHLGMGTLLAQLLEEYPGGDALILTDSESGDDLEEAWRREGRGRLVIWQMANSGMRVSKDASVVYLSGYTEEAWARLSGLLYRTMNEKGGNEDEVTKT